MEFLQREAIYLWYYFDVQLRQILLYWVLGMALGSAISVFLKDRIHGTFRFLGQKKLGLLGVILSSILGIASPLCIRWFYKGKPFFNFSGFEEPKSKDVDPNLVLRYIKNLWRNIKTTAPYFLLGLVLSALFQRYIPAKIMTELFGGNEAWGVLMAATIGVPLYACGGGTIPLLQQWLWEDMSVGSAASFMITGPATKITNPGALKIVLGARRFVLYLAYVMFFSLAAGLLVNWMI